MKFGVYFYPWYNEQRWRESPKRHMPLIGEYDSRNHAVIQWQADVIARCGFDYVIFEVVPVDDWCFGCCAQTIGLMIPELASRNVGWSFLIDAIPPPFGPERVHSMLRILDYIRDHGWEEGAMETPEGKRHMFAYSPWPNESEMLLETTDTYEWRFPLWVPHWGTVDEQFELAVHHPFAAGPKQLGISVFDFLAPRRYISFWESTLDTHCFDGFCSVIPGYDDKLLRRDPQLAPVVKHNSGGTLAGQFASAVRHKAEHVLVYGWNEYFETTNIEPTEQYGMLYVELIRRLIAEVRELE